MPSLSTQTWIPSRAEGLKRLAAFAPRAGRDYARLRNFDFGPGDRSNVSTLSPYLRHRLISEEEVARAAIERHGLEESDKFIQEVVWRTYYKGWMEQRPTVWTDYRRRVTELYRSLDRDPGLRERWESAVEGTTGIACLDAWSNELVADGYLHNHARMWHASLWIFTLQLPWELGADFYLRHLLDGDPASNTLSWRWVAGIQTPGKTYLATAENIARFTNGRFPAKEPFAKVASGVEMPTAPRRVPLARSDSPSGVPTGLFLNEDDLLIDGLPLGDVTIKAVAGGLATERRSPMGTSPVATTFAQGALTDGINRAAERFGVSAEWLGHDWDVSVLDWARSHGLQQIVTPYAPLGPAQEKLERVELILKSNGISLVRLRRPWDTVFWPLATAGFFPFKDSLPSALAILNIDLKPRSNQATLPFPTV